MFSILIKDRIKSLQWELFQECSAILGASGVLPSLELKTQIVSVPLSVIKSLQFQHKEITSWEILLSREK
jgi:hypothetical protein